MRVLLSGYTCDPNGGSEAALTWFTAYELARAGARVTLLTRAKDRARVEGGLRAASTRGVHLSVQYLDDTSLVVPHSDLLRSRGRYLTFQVRARDWVREHPGVDVAHHISWASLNYPIGVAESCRPVVIGPIGGGQSVPYGLEGWVDGRLRWERARRMIASAPLLPQVAAQLRSAAAVFATNEETERRLANLGSRSVGLLPVEAVRSDMRSLRSPVDPPRVVWLGRFHPVKGAGLALAAFRLVARDDHRAQMDFVGDGPVRPLIEQLSRDWGLQERVRFHGGIPWAEAQSILAGARVHLFTSLRDSFGAPVMEAAAQGVPTIGLDIGGLRTFCRRPGFRLVNPQPGEDLDHRLAREIEAVLALETPRWLALGDASREWAETHTHANRARLFLRLYESLQR